MPRKYCIPKFFARCGISCDQLPEHVYRRAKEIIEKLEDGAHFQSVGGKRMDFDRSKVSIPVGRRVVNAGSVGKPKDGTPQACYVELEANGRDLTVTFRRVPYDIERAAQAIEATEMPNEYAEMLRTGSG